MALRPSELAHALSQGTALRFEDARTFVREYRKARPTAFTDDPVRASAELLGAVYAAPTAGVGVHQVPVLASSVISQEPRVLRVDDTGVIIRNHSERLTEDLKTVFLKDRSVKDICTNIFFGKMSFIDFLQATIRHYTDGGEFGRNALRPSLSIVTLNQHRLFARADLSFGGQCAQENGFGLGLEINFGWTDYTERAQARAGGWDLSLERWSTLSPCFELGRLIYAKRPL